jgi:hypothetical protein
MNGYAQLETPDGEPIFVNADRVSFIRRFRGSSAASALNFEKGNYIVVKGNLEDVAKALAEA